MCTAVPSSKPHWSHRCLPAHAVLALGLSISRSKQSRSQGRSRIRTRVVSAMCAFLLFPEVE